METDQLTHGVIALDVGGSSVKSAVVVHGGYLLGDLVLDPIDSNAEADIILTNFASIIRNHLPTNRNWQLLGIALGFPGPFDYDRGVCLVENVEKYASIYGINIGEVLQLKINGEGISFRFRNDAEAAVVGEACYGAGSPYSRVIGITLGTGIGSAFTVNGITIRIGAGVPPNGWLYPVLFHGMRADDCFSRRGLEKRLSASGAATTDIKEAARMARLGDSRIRETFSSFGADLGEFLDPFIKSFQAEVVLVLGQISGAFDLFGPTLPQVSSVPFLPGRLGPEAALLGIADLFYKHCQEET